MEKGTIMEIKNIKKEKKNIYRITLDNQKEYLFYDDIIVKYSLIPKKKISIEELEQIKKESSSLESYYKSIEYLTYRLRNELEMKHYLEKKGYEEETIQKTIKKLKEEGYLNEIEYVKCFISDAFRLTSDRTFKINKKLLDLGCSIENIETELNHYSKEEWVKKLTKIYQKKVNSNHHEGKEKWIQKCNQYCYHLGYPFPWIEEISKNNISLDDETIIKKEYEKLKRKLERKWKGYELELKIKIKLYEKGFSKELIHTIIEENK